jgi:hypothetical protein
VFTINFTFCIIFISGYVCYSIFNLVMYFSPIIQEQYKIEHNTDVIPTTVSICWSLSKKKRFKNDNVWYIFLSTVWILDTRYCFCSSWSLYDINWALSSYFLWGTITILYMTWMKLRSSVHCSDTNTFILFMFNNGHCWFDMIFRKAIKLCLI